MVLVDSGRKAASPFLRVHLAAQVARTLAVAETGVIGLRHSLPGHISLPLTAVLDPGPSRCYHD